MQREEASSVERREVDRLFRMTTFGLSPYQPWPETDQSDCPAITIFVSGGRDCIDFKPEAMNHPEVAE